MNKNDLIESFRNALQGLKTAFLTERNLRIHAFFILAVVTTGLILKIANHEWIDIVFAIGLVVGAELFNTVIENVIDFVSKEENPVAKRIKDISAGAVLICALISTIIGVLIFLPKFFP